MTVKSCSWAESKCLHSARHNGRKRVVQCSEGDLWGAFLEGNDWAYETIYKKYFNRLCSYGMNLYRDQELVKDCLHDLFVYIYQHRRSLSQTNSIQYYLFRCLRRKIAVSKNARARLVRQNEADARVENRYASLFEDHLEQAENVTARKTVIFWALDRLSDKQKEIIHMFYFHNLSYWEISQIMNIELRTVYNQVHNAMTNLKGLVSKSAVY